MRDSSRGSRALKGTRERIVAVLRRKASTANEIAAQLGLTHNAVRSHLTVLQRDGVIRQASLQPSASRPAVVYELLPEAEAVFSHAYIPFVAQLVQVLQQRLAEGELDEVMRTVGRRLGAEWPRLRGPLGHRVKEASRLLEELGAVNEVETLDGGFVIRGHGCLLAEAIHGRPEVCRAMESLLAELLESSVRECCDRRARPRCCFAIAADGSTSGASAQQQREPGRS
ncbi:MAG: helix-turn-helix domain-containing protein [Gemmatimonadaceae bacterium]|nr:helix-turn-helix domain-containing protein [Gemmatimonadaceae bacterium]NUO95186.1 helix-turn-helix domain-containing protein [Gemmatimonadaceae bacterium]NUP55885.1 helix-turn-helix domain-containing protein [Gemmatimonadaceae bacterium]NUP72221.1 helix-turn-helix domain-containing protein [Gemmatimonadaceae bacterium]NUR34679.1 helix-turn-helix domain-containing protein [Gemmatimonadaceae bacterium]